MKKLHFEIQIQANVKKVWDAVVDDKKYREWTAAFDPTSYFEGGWEKGDKIRFIALTEKGEKQGMVSEIAESKKYSFISIRHLGFIQDGKEDTTSEAARKWTPAFENYTFTEMGTGTKFEVDVDVEDSYSDMFREMWPKALEKLRQVAER